MTNMSPQSKTKQKKWLVIGASSFGTMFEWYDFFLYGALAGYIAQHFFSGVNDATAFIFALAAFAAGFIVRPLGALVFGRIGDIVGRKNTFLVTMGIMGLSTFCVQSGGSMVALQFMWLNMHHQTNADCIQAGYKLPLHSDYFYP